MKFKWTASVCALLLVLALGAVAQNEASGTSNPQDGPVLKTRPPATPTQPDAGVYTPPPVNAVPPDAVPEGKRFIIKLKDSLDTKKLNDGKHFKAELREDLVTPSGLIIPKGRTIKGHVAQYEHGYTGARLMLAMDEIETRHGWVPLIATVTGVPGDPSIKSTGDEGELTKKGPDKKRMITNAAIGAGVGAVSGSVIGGGKGAAVGAAVGAGLGTGTSLLMRGNDMKLDKGTQLEVRLERDLTVPR
ncbi:MAG TPA: YMGG-like glycine zipper-containing protein [Candidatus Acidoferrales bacterium]|jgi:YmgG-like glycine-zipper protein|nr:YMGG-like glycine zipper-containing protein [Candidatus Acidoferrales bacterium]